MCQSKVRAENMQHACDLVVDHLGCGPSGQVGPKQLFMLSGGDRVDSVMIQSNNFVENIWAQRVEAIDLFFIQK